MDQKEIQEMLAEYTAQYGPIASQQMADVLYDYYAEVSPLQNEAVWACHQALRAAVDHLMPDERQTVLDAAEALANAQEKAAFHAALRISV